MSTSSNPFLNEFTESVIVVSGDGWLLTIDGKRYVVEGLTHYHEYDFENRLAFTETGKKRWFEAGTPFSAIMLIPLFYNKARGF